MKIKKGRECSFIALRLLRYNFFSDYGRLDILLKQFQMICCLVFGKLYMKEMTQHGAFVIKFLSWISHTKITNWEKWIVVSYTKTNSIFVLYSIELKATGNVETLYHAIRN